MLGVIAMDIKKALKDASVWLSRNLPEDNELSCVRNLNEILKMYPDVSKAGFSKESILKDIQEVELLTKVWYESSDLAKILDDKAVRFFLKKSDIARQNKSLIKTVKNPAMAPAKDLLNVWHMLVKQDDGTLKLYSATEYYKIEEEFVIVEEEIVKRRGLFRKPVSEKRMVEKLAHKLKPIASIDKSKSDQMVVKIYNKDAYKLFETPMVRVHPGSFQMGSDDGKDREQSVHTVEITKGFFIGKYQVTHEEWEKVMGSNPNKFKGGNLPVENVSWYDAVEYCNKRSEWEGLLPCYTIDKNKIDPGNENDYDEIKWTVDCNFSANGYRLPTEAEWEYAARGGNKSKGYKYAGSNSLGDVGWYRDNSKGYTHIVGRKQPNELGIYDMSGNVLEWCWDWYEKYTSSCQVDPGGPSSGSDRVYHGGGWGDGVDGPRLAYRDSCYPCYRGFYFGFRPVRTE